LLANVVSGYDPNDTAVRERLSAPTAKHLLGTDELGRDLFARIAFGARYSLTIAALTAIGSIVLGTCLASSRVSSAGWTRPSCAWSTP
jgi:peptide/nickel transport system permease protein